MEVQGPRSVVLQKNFGLICSAAASTVPVGCGYWVVMLKHRVDDVRDTKVTIIHCESKETAMQSITSSTLSSVLDPSLPWSGIFVTKAAGCRLSPSKVNDFYSLSRSMYN